MSKLLGGAQYILTGRFGQHIACKKPFTSWCLWALAGGSPWGTRLWVPQPCRGWAGGWLYLQSSWHLVSPVYPNVTGIA